MQRPSKRRYYSLYCKIKAAENQPVVLHVPAAQQYTVKRMLGKERIKDKTLVQRDSHILRFSNATATSITVMWYKYSGVGIEQQVNAGLFLNVEDELDG